MKKIIAGVLLSAFGVAAFAACPPYQPYGCHPVGTKMQCGCGQ